MTQYTDDPHIREAIEAVSAILRMVPARTRAEVIEQAFAGAMSDPFCAWFRERFGAMDSSGDPLPVLLISGEIADDVMNLYGSGDAKAPDDDEGAHCEECGLHHDDGHLPSCSHWND